MKFGHKRRINMYVDCLNCEPHTLGKCHQVGLLKFLVFSHLWPHQYWNLLYNWHKEWNISILCCFVVFLCFCTHCNICRAIRWPRKTNVVSEKQFIICKTCKQSKILKTPKYSGENKISGGLWLSGSLICAMHCWLKRNL